jgi:hypothetical protein
VSCRFYKYYSVYDRDTDMPILIHATAKECYEAMGVSPSSFYSYVSHSNRGTRKNKYIIYVDEDEEDLC